MNELMLLLSVFSQTGPEVASSARPAMSNPVPPAGQVAIYRDEWGVPNIFAQREADGFYGFGYAQAEDGAEELYLSILAARGTVAASVTPDELSAEARATFPSVDAMIENDYQAKLWRVHEESQASVTRLDPQLRRNYSQFLAGIAAFARKNPSRIPKWAPQRLEVADMVAVGQWTLWMNYQAGDGLQDCRRSGLTPATFKMAKGVERSAAAPPAGFSNEWAVMPRLTSTGGAILLSDPHGPINSRFYEYRVHAGDFHSSGFSLGPMMVLARNKWLGWAMTTGAPDIADCYRVTTAGDNSAYLFDGRSTPIESRVANIDVKGRTSEQVVLKYTRHNGVPSPVVRELPGVVYVVSTPYYKNLEGFHNSLYLMNKASDVEGFRTALAGGGMFPQNLLAADTKGDILYIRAGLTPRRPDGAMNWSLILDGNTSRTQWKGIHPTADLLSIKSPDSGFLQNNNVHPKFMAKPAPETLSRMPDYLYDDWSYSGPTSRSEAALRVLGETSQMTELDAFDLALSVRLVDAESWMKLLKLVVTTSGVNVSPSGPRGAFMHDLLQFDGQLLADSTSALKYIYFREALRSDLALEDMSNLAVAYDTPERLSARMRARFISAIDTALARNLAAPGGLGRRYGDEFRLLTGEGSSAPMSGGNLRQPADGITECHVQEMLCGTTLQAVFYSKPDENGKRFARSGSRIMRLDFYAPSGIRSFSMQNPGQVHRSGSSHSYDQARELLSRRKLKKVHFDWSDLQQHVKSKLILRVE